jgi:hypothetical protein
MPMTQTKANATMRIAQVIAGLSKQKNGLMSILTRASSENDP